MTNQHSLTLSKVVLGCLALYFLYLFTQTLSVVKRRHIGTNDGTYINSTNENQELYVLAHTLTKNCQNSTCQVQLLLNYVSNIPYKINNFTAHSPQKTIQMNFGDCDDKSNLLISLLHELNIESYFVLVPQHIFVIVSAENIHLNDEIKGLYLNGKKFYILESTAKGSTIGFPLRYAIKEIDAIIDPFENRKLDISHLEWKQ
jgi:hypothetical protein